MAHGTASTTWSQGESFVGKLAQFFPSAIPVRLPAHVTREDAQGRRYHEPMLIEFGTPREVIFASALPLEFSDHIRLEEPDGTLIAEATVVAVQYHNGKMAVAARFIGEVANWIIKR